MTRPVYRKGTGPGVVVIHEIPGITEDVIGFGDEVVEAGFTVVMPHLFGHPEARSNAGTMTGAFIQVCTASEFTKLATGVTTPMATWLRSLARSLHEELGGPGVGALGMCFTGGFALAMAVDDTMLAPVLSQPSLPFAGGKARKRALGLSDADLATVAAREDLCVLAMRFTGDPAVPAERFQHLREVFGDRLIAVEIENRKGQNPHNLPRAAHSVVTEHLVDEPGHPTKAALDQVLAFFADRLTT
jgi:dienelactone hydrolase